jgi:hypothetical protein
VNLIGTTTGSGTWVNQGNIGITGAGTVLYLRGNVWDNQNIINANASGGTILFDLDNTITNEAGANWEATSGGTLTLGGAWNNLGTLTENNSTLNLGGSFGISNIGLGSTTTFNRSGGSVNITGTLNNASTSLDLTNITGPWFLWGGTISSGTVTTSGTNTLTVYQSGTLSNVTSITGALILADFDTYSSVTTTATVIGDLAINGTLSMGRSTRLYFSAPTAGTNQHLTGNVAVTMHGTSGGGVEAIMDQAGTAHTVTLGSGVAISASGNVNLIGTTTGSGTWVNQGSISITGSGTILYLRGNVWDNQNIINANASGGTITFDLDNTLTNEAGANWEATGGTLSLSGGWSNAGTISVAAGTLTLGGTFNATTGIGTWSRSGGTVNITGNITNTGNTLTFGATTTGSWNLSGGTINGGTLASTDSSTLVGTSVTGTLNGVTLNTGPDLATNNSAGVIIKNNLTLAPGLTLQVGNTAGTTAERRQLDRSADQR